MRDLILNNESYTEEQWREIADYNRDDVLLTIPLLEAIAPTIDVPAALYRGRYAIAVVDMESRGIPISLHAPGRAAGSMAGAANVLHPPRRRVRPVRRRRILQGRTVSNLVDGRGWATSWPRTTTGKLALTTRAIGKQAKQHPELKPLQHLRDQIAELRLGSFSTPSAPMAIAAVQSCRSGPAPAAISRAAGTRCFCCRCRPGCTA